MQEVGGSIPPGSTNSLSILREDVRFLNIFLFLQNSLLEKLADELSLTA